MPLETTRVTVPDDSYTIVRSGVTNITLVKRTFWDLRVYITEPGSTAPSPSSAYIDWFANDYEFIYNDVPCDIYIMSPEGETEIGALGR